MGISAALILAAVVATAAAPSGATAAAKSEDKCSIMHASISLGITSLISIFVPGAKVSATSAAAAVERAIASPDPAVARYAQTVETLAVLYDEVCK